jgi:hypothetical protein
LREIAATALADAGGLPNGVRLDIIVNGPLSPDHDKRLAELVRQVVIASDGEPTEKALAGPFAAIVASRQTEPQRLPDSMMAGRLTVGTTPIQLLPENGSLTISRSLASTRAKRVRDLVKQAKTQLPDVGPCGIFIQMNGAQSAAEQLKQMIGRPAHEAIVWAGTWTGLVPQHAIWRQDQPFDQRLLDERSGTS